MLIVSGYNNNTLCLPPGLDCVAVCANDYDKVEVAGQVQHE